MNRAERKYGSHLKLVDEKVKKAIRDTFDVKTERLPSKDIIKPLTGEDDLMEFLNNKNKIKQSKELEDSIFLSPYIVRELYLEQCFVAYTDEFITAIKNFTDSKKFRNVYELCSGTGWFSYWMKKYGIPIKGTVDNMRWQTYNGKFMDHVEKHDAPQFVSNNLNADLFILSWPYMDDVAFRIWKNMKPGQYLLYIGEGMGGCTADDSFFIAVEGHEIEDDKMFNKIGKEFIQFRGIHDRPLLYKK